MISIALLGPTEVRVDDQLVPAAQLGGRPRQILEVLALDAGSAVPKDRLADLLWDGEPPASYMGTLESYVCVLRRRLGLASGRRSALATTSSGYLLDPSAVNVDVLEFRRLLARAASAGAADVVATTVEALQLVRGELLADEPYAAWAIRARDVFVREAVAACVRAAQLASAIGDFTHALQLAQWAVDHDRLREAGWQHLIRVHWLTGHRSDALRAYAELRAVLLDELGEEPGGESQELYLAILRDLPATRVQSPTDEVGELRTLMVLLRQVLDALPGVGAPPTDAALTAVASRVLAQTG